MSAVLEITGVGVRTPLGRRVAAVAAAVRARINRITSHPFFVDQVGDLMPGALDPWLDPRAMGPRRLLALAETALRDACAPLVGRALPSPVPLFLALPEVRPGFREQDAEFVEAGLRRVAGLPVDLAEVNLLTAGHAAGFAALRMAAERSQDCPVCLVGGVDSYFHPDTMEWLDVQRQLCGAISRSGFVPGEGAGFCLLMDPRARARLGIATQMRVRAVSVGTEVRRIKTDEMCLGQGLTTVVEDAVTSLRQSERRIDDIYCDINGERYRGEEWGFVCLRLGHSFVDPTGYHAPAEYWGDMGAASWPLFAALACQAAARGYARGPHALSWASSEAGLRGAALLEAIPSR